MKIRIKGNYIRYRLTQSEVKLLSDQGQIAETTCFGSHPSQVFTYALVATDKVIDLSADFDGQKITMYLPIEAAKNWNQEERVGFQHSQEVAPGQVLQLLLEKDFVCLDDTAEDQSDNYANPKR